MSFFFEDRMKWTFKEFQWIIGLIGCLSIVRSQQTIDVCLQGPNFWCLNETTENLCHFTNKKIGLCGLSNKRCQIKTGDEFCKSKPPSQQQSPFQYNGGLTGVDENLFSYYMLSLYWPPSTCPLHYNETSDFLQYFCSPYTNLNEPGSERLVLHGLWPTFSTDGDYQGWPQYCSTNNADWSVCHIDGNLCPWTNTSRNEFSQSNYEYCMARENIQRCIVNGTEVLDNERERLKIFAPGYLNRYNLFLNHEWTKHGSCCSSIFDNDISTYMATMLDLVDFFTGPSSLTDQFIQRYAGDKIGLDYLETAFNKTAIISCNSKCQLEEFSLCLNRDQFTGLPTRAITCPDGARNSSNSCRKSRCDFVSIPTRRNTTTFVFPQSKILKMNLIQVFIVFLVLKVFLFCITLCLSRCV